MSWAWTMAGGWLLPGVLAGALLLLVARALARCAGEPARRQRLADLGVAAALLAVALSFGPRWLSVPLSTAGPPEPAPADEAPAADPAPMAPDPAPVAPPGPDWVWVMPIPPAEEPAAPPAAEEPAPPAADAPPPPAPAPWGDELRASAGWLGAVHGAGAAVLLGRWMLGYVGLWRLLRAARPVPPEVAAVCRSLCAGRAVPRLLQSPRVRAPFSCGVFRPTVLLPASLCTRPEAAALRWVLAHELTHLRRRDVWGCLLFGLAEVVFYPVPWFWSLRRQARLSREYLADAAAAAQGGTAADYAQFLLDLIAAPAPAGALGVTGHTSDLFWRVAMLLRSSGAAETRAPRLWSLGVAAGLLSLAALVTGAGPRDVGARADEPAKKEEPKKEQPKKDDAKKAEPKKDPNVDFPDVDELLKNLPAGIDPEQLKALRENLQQAMQQLHRQLPAGRFAGGMAPPLFGGGGFAGPGQGFNPFGDDQQHDGRLGARIKEPGATLVDQLDLPKGQGVVIEDVTADSPAAKAGLKPNDILLEVGGKPVSSNVADAVKMINGLKADKPVNAVVLRKGKKETIKGLSLPEAKKAAAGFRAGGGIGFPGGAGGFGGGAAGAGGLPGFPGMPGLPGGVAGFGGFAGGANGVMTTVFRSDDRFTARHQEGNLVITVTGTVADGKAATKSITVQDGAKSEKYEGVNKVPEEYRDKVKNLVEMGEKGAVKVEVK